MAKKILIGIGILVVLLIIVALVLPMFINVNKFKPTLETSLTNALGRKVAIGNINLSVFSGGITVDDVSIGDDPAFSQSPFLSAKQLTVGVALFPLIFSQRLEVSSFTITDPQVTLLRSPAGKWNFSSLGANAGRTPSKNSGSATANFSVAKLTISNGTLTVGTAGAPGKKKHYQTVDLEASDLSYTTQFPFELTAKTPGGGSIKLTGKAGPVNPADASLTPMTATMAVTNLDLASTGFIDASSGLGGVVDFNGDINSDGETTTSKGTVKASNLKLVPAGSPAKVPVNIDYATRYDLRRESGALTQGNVHIGKALATLTGTYDMSGATTSVQMKLEGKAMPAPDLEGVLPAVGVSLPSAASLQSGALDTTLAISGPVDNLIITGPVRLANAKLAGFNLLGKLGALASFAGMKTGSGSDTEIQTLSTNARVDATGTHLQDLNLVVPSIGAITGDGNISRAGQLDCKMNAKLGNASSPAGVMTSAFSQIASGAAKNGIPFKITGTTSSPVFEPDLTGMAQGVVGTPKNAAGVASGILGGLLKKKKNQ